MTVKGAIIFIVLFFTLSAFASAQNVLLLSKSGTKKQTIYKSGDEIVYRLKGEEYFRQDYIVTIKDSTLVFHYNKINIKDIDAIDIRKKNFIKINLKELGSKLQIAGAFYIALDQFNRTIVQGDEWEFDRNVWITGAGIVAIGTGIKFLHPKIFKVGGRYKLRIININYYYDY